LTLVDESKEATLREQILQWNTILYCERWDETIRFYRDLLKLPIDHETDWFVGFQITSQAFLSVAHAERTTLRSAQGDGVTLSLRVKDVDSVHRAFTGLGLEPGDIRTVWGARAFYLHDPEGHRIEVWAHGTTHSPDEARPHAIAQ
jgi:catechol 2,3-dioxygenase-like lactoylglutathione lyase family enzyme